MHPETRLFKPAIEAAISKRRVAAANVHFYPFLLGPLPPPPEEKHLIFLISEVWAV